MTKVYYIKKEGEARTRLTADDHTEIRLFAEEQGMKEVDRFEYLLFKHKVRERIDDFKSRLDKAMQ